MKKLLLSLLLSLAIISAAYAKNTFTYQGHPISPNCLTKFMNINNETRIKQVNLTKCSPAKQAKHIYLKNNFYQIKSKSTSQRPNPYSLYKTMGNVGNTFLVFFGQWTGGSGFFTDIILVKKQGKQLLFEQSVDSGDRCNGGVSIAGPWKYGVALTPTSLILLAPDKSIKIKAYKDLDASAAGCVAKAIYHYNYKTKKPEFLYAELSKQVKFNKKWAKQFTYQNCFDKLFRSYVSKGTLKLNKKALDIFVQTFKERCITNTFTFTKI